MFLSLLSRFKRNESGNIAMMFALSAPVLMVGIGFAVDYGLYARDRVRLEMIADEAALSMVSTAGMELTPAAAQTFATNLFCAQATQIPRLDISTPAANVTQCASNLSFTTTVAPGTGVRTVTVNFQEHYVPIFWGAMFGSGNMPLGGLAKTQSATASGLNTNFYLLLDNQGSMALPASAAGIAQMQALTPLQNPGGCAYACHEQAPNSPIFFGADTQGNPCVPGTSGRNCPQVDNYTVARNNGITLRFDEVIAATNALMTDAQQTQAESNPQPTYQIAVYSVDAPYSQGLYQVMPLTANYATQWASSSSNLALYTVWSDGDGCVASGGNPCATGASTENSRGQYLDVGFFSSPMGKEMTSLASTIPAAGDGKAGDNPKESLIIVTDGVEEAVNGSSLYVGLWDSNALSACTTLKNNGVQIAILYTTYFPTPGFWLYDDYIAQYNPGTANDKIASTLQSCATPGLFMTAGVNDNLTTDLLKLFNMANQSSKLLQ